ncbi:hypothetical protein AB4Z17_26980 [Paenibacillus sp. TAF43_2]|uniref:hypothetical protein n=2 Tax=unclassified Paenibacillus TaxID=185978 RepID=UPI003F964777
MLRCISGMLLLQFCHGMIVSLRSIIAILHEFLKAGMFSSEISIPFTMGTIKGYHGDQEPDEKFWTLYCLYLAMTIISSIVWILKVRPVELPIMAEKLERVLEDHHYFDSIVPRWYLEVQEYETGSL